jgi:hypothetical protein
MSSKDLSREDRLLLYLDSARSTIAVMVGVLAAFGVAVAVKEFADQHDDLVILAVALAWTASWVQRGTDVRNLALTLVVLPVLAVAAVGIADLMDDRPNVGDAVFVAVFGASIWVRRFGVRATRAGTLAVLPLIGVLVLQGPVAPTFDDAHTAWVALVAFATAVIVVVAQYVGGRSGFVPPQPPTLVPQQRRPGDAGGRRRLSASTRMALQLVVALAAAFAAGRQWYPDHWAWVVLTAFIVCSGARARTDVLQRGLLRAGGAAVGTVAATYVAIGLGADDPWSIVGIFVLLAFATWLRPVNYAYWAGCVTALLSLLFGYYGEAAPDLLRTRLEAIVVGAVLGIAASWLILPIRTAVVARRRTAEALGVLGTMISTQPWEPAVLAKELERFDLAMTQLEQAVRPFVWARRLPGRRQADVDFVAAVAAVRGCRPAAAALVELAGRHPELDAAPEVAALRAPVRANLDGIRLAVGMRPGPPRRDPAVTRSAPGPRREAVEALRALDGELATLAGIFPRVPAATPARVG